jgi:RNA polymerase sigma factor (sigma-70 family)
MMIKPSIDQLTNGGEINRYELVIATSKVVRVITDEYCVQRERAESMIRNGETDKSLATLIKGNIRDKKAVENAVQALADGEFEIDIEDTDSSSRPDIAYLQNIEAKAVRESIGELPTAARELIILRDVEGLSYSEIAQTLGIAEGTLKSKLFRARARLRLIILSKSIL